MSSSGSSQLPKEIFDAADRGELPKVVKWLRKGGHVDALCSWEGVEGRRGSTTLLHAAAQFGQLAVAKELLKRGASVDLPSGYGATPLMEAAVRGHLAVLLLGGGGALLHHLRGGAARGALRVRPRRRVRRLPAERGAAARQVPHLRRRLRRAAGARAGAAGGGRPDVCAAQVRRGGWEKGGLTERPERLTVIRGREHGSAHERDTLLCGCCSML